MSYLPGSLRSRRENPEPGDASRRGAARAAATPRPGEISARATAAHDLEEEHDDDDTDWARVGAFGAGIALGALIGAGAALLLAPQSGPELRRGIALRARGARLDARDAWDELGDQLDDLRRSARRKLRGKRRDARRSVTRGRWAVEDALDG